MSLHDPGLYRAHLQGERNGRDVARLPLDSSATSPRQSDPSIDLRHNVGAFVDTAAQMQNCITRSISQACCFDHER